MLWRVLQVTIPAILVLSGEDGNALETPPPDAKDEWVVAFENLLVPAMLLEAASNQPAFCLLGSQTTNDQGHDGIERFNELRRNAIDPHTTIQPLT
jgi:hypothetical protein